MLDDTPTYGSIAPLRNVRALAELIERVQERADGLPGMACFHGPSGYGKTSAAAFAVNRHQAHHVQVKSCWTRKKLCTAILKDIGIQPARTIADMVDQIAEALLRSGRPLLIDEVDHLVDQQKNIELVRDIHESSHATVILIGEEQLPMKLLQWERVHGRMADWVAAEPATLADVGHLAPIYSRGVGLDADLQARLLDESGASMRRIAINLGRVREFGLRMGKKQVSLADFADERFFSGEAPAPRRVAR